MDFPIEILENDSVGISQFLDDRIYEYNSTSIGHNDGRLFAMRVLDQDNEVVAGITGWTWATVSEITLFWVREDSRKKGFGKKLLKAAEDEILRRGCNTILLRSYSFQAPDFYVKNGYTVHSVIDNFPPGQSLYNLTKSLR